MCCLGSASDWLNQISHAARPIRSTTQIWVVTRHQYGTSALVSHTGEETRGSVAKKKMPEAWKIRNWQKIKTESTRKLSNFNFQWIKPCTRIISITLYFLTLFEGYKCNKLYEITLKKKLSWKPEKTNFKSFKFHKMKSYAWRGFYLCFSNPVKSEIYFVGFDCKIIASIRRTPLWCRRLDLSLWCLYTRYLTVVLSNNIDPPTRGHLDRGPFWSPFSRRFDCKIPVPIIHTPP